VQEMFWKKDYFDKKRCNHSPCWARCWWYCCNSRNYQWIRRWSEVDGWRRSCSSYQIFRCYDCG